MKKRLEDRNAEAAAAEMVLLLAQVADLKGERDAVVNQLAHKVREGRAPHPCGLGLSTGVVVAHSKGRRVPFRALYLSMPLPPRFASGSTFPRVLSMLHSSSFTIPFVSKFFCSTAFLHPYPPRCLPCRQEVPSLLFYRSRTPAYDPARG